MIPKLCEALSAALTVAHAAENLSAGDKKALWELQANLCAVLPRQPWLENYTKGDR